MIPDRTTVGRFFIDRDGKLWLHEYADRAIVSLMDGYYSAKLGEFQRPERLLLVPGDDGGLTMLDEPIAETLRKMREAA